MIEKHIVSVEAKRDPIPPNVLHAMFLIREAWENVTNSTTKNCFNKSGFKSIDSLPPLYDDSAHLTLKLDSIENFFHDAIDIEEINEMMDEEDQIKVFETFENESTIVTDECMTQTEEIDKQYKNLQKNTK